MEVFTVLFALLIPPAAIVAAVSAWRGLSHEDTHKLRLAVWFVAVPWLGVLIFGGLDAIDQLFSAGFWSVLIVASSLAVAVAVPIAWAWQHYRLRTTGPAALTSIKRGVDRTMQEPAFLPTAAIADLRLPGWRASAIATTLVVAGVWLLASTDGGRIDASVELAQALSFLGTLLMSAVATTCAMAFVFRRAPVVAAIYSGSALCVMIGIVSLLTLVWHPDKEFEWREIADYTDFQLAGRVLPPLFIFLTTLALMPALVALMIDLRRWYRER